MKRCGIAILLGLAALSCMKLPQTRPEFLSAMQASSSSWVSVDEKIVERDLDSILAVLEARSRDCFDVAVRETHRTGGPQVISTTAYFVPSLQRTRADGAEYTLRLIQRPRSVGAPKEGIFYAAVDLIREGKTTRTKRYFPRKRDESLVAALESWASGTDAPCPKLFE